MDLVQGLDAVSLHVKDIKKAHHFYTKVLGLKEIHYDEKTGNLRVAAPDGAQIAMHIQMDGEIGRPAGTISGIMLRVADAQKAMDEVNRRGGKAHNLWPAPWGTTYVDVEDPDGNILLLTQRR